MVIEFAFLPEEHGIDGTRLATFATIQNPILFRQIIEVNKVREDNGFHDLPHQAIAQKHDKGAVLIGQIKGHESQLCQFLAPSRSQHGRTVVAMSTAPSGLEIVRRRRSDIAQPRPAAHHVHDDRRQFLASHVRDAFLF